MWIWWGNSPSLLHPPYSRPADIAVSLFFFPYITSTPISPRPPFGATMFSSLWLLVFIVDAAPPADAHSIHLPLSILAIIYHHHPRVAHPVVAKEVGHGVLEVSCREGSRHPPTAPLITILAMSFAYYHTGGTVTINPCADTVRNLVIVTHLAELALGYTPLPALLQIGGGIRYHKLRPLIHRQAVLPC